MPNHFSDRLVRVPSARIARTVSPIFAAKSGSPLSIATATGSKNRKPCKTRSGAPSAISCSASRRGDDGIDLAVRERLNHLLAIGNVQIFGLSIT